MPVLQAPRRGILQALFAFSLFRSLFFGLPFALTSPLVEPDLRSVAVTLTLVYAGLSIFGLVIASRNEIVLGTVVLLVITVFRLVAPSPGDTIDVIITVVVAATLTNSVTFVVLMYIVVLRLLRLFVLEAGAQPIDAVTFVSLVNPLTLLIGLPVIGFALRYYFDTLESTGSETERSANLLRLAAEIGQVTVGMVNMGEMLMRAVEFIRDRFGFYHVQVFLVDDAGEQAMLAASTGEVGRQLLDRKHRLAVGSRSVIGQVTATGEPIVARDTDRDVVHYRNELLPDTRAELALPITDGENVIGALDVQSTRRNDFQPNDVQTLQILANLLSAAILNARFFERQQQSVRENQRLYIEAEANLREIQRLNRQLTKESWEEYIQAQGAQIGVTMDGGQLARDNDWTPLLTQASVTRQPASDGLEGSERTIAVPIILRGEVIGSMEVTPDESFDEMDTVEMMRAVAERLAVGLDNARLFEGAQESTAYEQRINSIVSNYQSAETIDDLLRITVSELSKTFGSERASIRLSSQPTENGTSTGRLP